MEITDAQFNVYFSIKYFAALLAPLALVSVMDRFSLHTLLVGISVTLVIG